MNLLSTKPCVVLVDTYETADHGLPQTARHIAPAFMALGADCVRVQSAPDAPGQYRQSSPTMSNYRENIVHDGDLAKTLHALAVHRPVAVVAGGEYAVAFTDELGEALGVPSNGTALSPARRDKAAMGEAVAAAGLPVARQLSTSDEAELAAWHREVGGRIVVKPNRSAGGDGVSFCDTPERSVEALRTITGRQNVFSEDNDLVIAQEYLAGTEYMVNTVSMDGLHQVCDIWKTSRFAINGVSDLLGACQIVPRRGPGHDELVNYAFAVLDALGIRHGAAHVEIKRTPRGPRLIEVGSRLSGGDLPHLARLAIGESQLDWMADAVLRPERFRERWGEDYRIRRHYAWSALLSPVEGTLRRYTVLDEIERLESFHEMFVLTEPGKPLRRTVDDTTFPVVVTFMHEIEEYVLRDLGTLRYLDGVGCYELEP
ncbi:ATP-grasp domain-containing protein [Amycolatopsis sp. NPDC058340]|uniref:ATP-grasp domain-containing protein n=1 Tax=Amycolatopsis sp. NPDC058340 TaxID=3346453 RepID=UPI003665FBAB